MHGTCNDRTAGNAVGVVYSGTHHYLSHSLDHTSIRLGRERMVSPCPPSTVVLFCSDLPMCLPSWLQPCTMRLWLASLNTQVRTGVDPFLVHLLSPFPSMRLILQLCRSKHERTCLTYVVVPCLSHCHSSLCKTMALLSNL